MRKGEEEEERSLSPGREDAKVREREKRVKRGRVQAGKRERSESEGEERKRRVVRPGPPSASAADRVMILGTKEKASASGAHTLYRGIVARSHSINESVSEKCSEA